MLHRLHELDAIVRESYREYDFKKIVAQLIQFMAVDLSAFYFDVRKDALYCDPLSSVRRKARCRWCGISSTASSPGWRR